MKRVGYLFDDVVGMDNLRLAFWKASRGKRARDDQHAFAQNLEENLQAIRRGLIDGSYPIGNYRRFTVYEPKERLICAAAFPERVLHHALMNVCEPWIEKWLIFDTYACRRGKGQLKALHRARTFAARNRWFLKCDFRKYFDSIPHDGLMKMLSRKFKDGHLVAWFERIVKTYEVTPGHGLPIGNLTSQHLANLYLDRLDRLHALPYVRYMDDFVYWSDDKEELKRVRRRVVEFADAELGLALKGEPFINQTAKGMDFLGMRIFPQGIRLARKSKERFMRKARLYAWLAEVGVFTQEDYQERMTALVAFTEEADTRAWRKSFFRKLTSNVWLEPLVARRQLEQQRAELPFCQPQQQQPVQLQQQLRLPPLLLRSTIHDLEENDQSPSVSRSRQTDKERIAA